MRCAHPRAPLPLYEQRRCQMWTRQRRRKKSTIFRAELEVVAEALAGDAAMAPSLFPRSPDDRPATIALALAGGECRNRPIALRKESDPAAASGRNSTPDTNARSPRVKTCAIRNHSKRRSPSNSTSSHPTVPTCNGVDDSIRQPPLLTSRTRSGTSLSTTAFVIA